MSTQHKTPDILHFDLVVTGGGLAGLCAAIAAARQGLKTAILQDRPVFGGNSSSEVRVVPYGCAHSHAWSGETGIVHEFQLEDRPHNHEEFFDHGMMNSLWDMTLSESARREANLSTFFNASVRGVESEALEGEKTPRITPNGLGRTGGQKRRIMAVHASQMGSEKELVFRAKQFVDATGDGTIGFLAGADFRYGRESRDEFGEPLAPLKSDDVTMGSTITMRARDCGKPVPFVAPPWIEEYKSLEEIGFNRKLYHLNKPTYGGYWWLEVCNPWHQIEDNAAIRDELHRHVLGVWNFIKNHSEDKEAARNYVLEWVGQIPGKRESRRLMGDVIVSEKDVQSEQNWPDGVAYAGWWIDLHISGGILNKTEPGERENVDDNYKHWIRVAPFSIPLRAMYSRNIENLWMAGRCYSLTHVGLGPVRVQLTLGMQGQAVGTAAAYAIHNGLTPRETANPEDRHIQTIRQQLLRDDCRVLGLKNSDAADIARQASVTASSEAPFDLGAPNEMAWQPLDKWRGQIVPLTANRLEWVEFFLKNESDEAVPVVAELHQLERIWDRTPGKYLECANLRVPARSSGWVRAIFDADVVPDTPHRLVLRPAKGVWWAQGGDAQGGEAPTGTIAQFLYECAGGPEPKNAHFACFSPDQVEIPAYKHWRQSGRAPLAARLHPNPQPFAARMVNNGGAWPEDLPNLWKSDPSQALPQSCTLQWPDEVEFNGVQLLFDTNLTTPAGSRAPLESPAECVRHFRLFAQIGDGERLILEEKENSHRLYRAHFETVRARALRLEVVSTWGDASARIFEMRVSNS